MKKYIFLVIIALLILYGISSMSYEQQTIIPSLRQLFADKPFYNLLSKIEVTYWGNQISVETRGYYYFVEFLIRKATHFVGFGIIALFIYLFYRKKKWTFAMILAIGTTFIIACLDEFHQTFVKGRTGVFDDVLIDTAGAITFIILFKIGKLLYYSFKYNRLKKN